MTEATPKKAEGQKYPKTTSVPIDCLVVEEGFNTAKTGSVDDLVASFSEAGMENPIHIRRKPGSYNMFIIDGHRRYRAAQEAKLTVVPIVDHGYVDDVAARIIAYRQNLLRRKPSKKEVMTTCRFLHEAGMGGSEIARTLCLGKSTVSEYLTLLRAEPKLRKAAEKKTSEGGIPTKAALRAAKLPKAQQKRAAPKLAGKTSREAEQVLGPPRPKILSTPSAGGGVGQKIGVLMPGEKLSKDYRLVSDYRERCQKLELEVATRLRQTPSNQRLQGMELVIGVLRGKLTVEQAFVNWQKV